MPVVSDVQHDRFAWREAGTGDLVVLFHGLGGSRISWDAQLAGLSDRHRVVAWDLPGYGAAAPLPDEPLTFRALADAAADLITRARPRSRPRGRHLDGRHDRPVPGCMAPGDGAIAHPAREQPGVRPRRHRPRPVACGPTGTVGPGPAAVRLRRARAAVARRPPHGRCGVRPATCGDGTHHRRRAAAQHRVPRHARHAPAAGRHHRAHDGGRRRARRRDTRRVQRSTSPSTSPVPRWSWCRPPATC